jgi:hypothetical protein
MLDRGELLMLEFERGDDREGPYTCNVQSDDGDQTDIELTIKDSKVIKRPTRKLVCPFCSYDGSEESEHGGTFRYLADTTIYREIVRFIPGKRGEKPILLVQSQAERY